MFGMNFAAVPAYMLFLAAGADAHTELEQKSDAGSRIAFFTAFRKRIRRHDPSITDKTVSRLTEFYRRTLKQE